MTLRIEHGDIGKEGFRHAAGSLLHRQRLACPLTAHQAPCVTRLRRVRFDRPIPIAFRSQSRKVFPSIE